MKLQIDNINQEFIVVEGREYPVDFIIQTISPFLTPERLEKIKTTAQKRSWGVAPLLENIYDRGNISAVMRSAEAFGYINFNILEYKNEKFKAANRVTQGTDKWLFTTTYNSPVECVQALKKQNYQILATHLDAAKPIDEVDFTIPTAVVFGNEKDGVSPELLKLIDGNFIIPMMGFAQSFNISVAAALTFYHAHQARKKAMHKEGDLNPKQVDLVSAYYMLQSLDSAKDILARS